VFMPSALYSVIGDALTGKIRCGYTNFTIATNSANTTDLAPINVFATYQLLSLAKAANKSAKTTLKILEMNRPQHTTTYSLHTKASIFGDDVVIGSANADIRSYHMDTNNAFYIRNAPQLTAQYKKWVADFIDPTKGRFSDKTAIYRGLTYAQANAINGKGFDDLILKYGKKLSPDGKVKVKKLFMETCADVYEDSQFFLSRQLKDLDDRERQRVLKPRTQAFDSKYQIF
jgi:cardiolipin synthase C